MQFIRKSAS
ncbi:hypothetical protein F383_28442 [Gossypium arboreum]|uniref:Uncharacterized protein n=1 Tax=Gossypium arboreum TaxID=29729 RepID=A0A0B0PDC2_GOSAR|nr:hypothetical protein F383_28442 [Gossypium arboreum]